MRITHQQIADQVGVSRTVVTEALHRTSGARINPDTRSEILLVAKKLGYQPRNVTTHSIGYVLPVEDLNLETETGLLMQFEETLRAQGYRLTLASTRAADNRDALREVLNAKTVDGVIFNRWMNGQIRELLPPQIPWVLTSDEDGVGPEVDLVALDAARTARNITEYLIGFGHERMCLIVGYAEVKFHRSIIQGVCGAMAAAGLPRSNLKMIRPYFIEAIPQALLPLMEESDAPTAIVVVTPGQAITSLYALRCAGYQIPGDVSMVAMIDNERYKALPPLLTSTDALGPQLSEQVTRHLMQKINRCSTTLERVLVPGQIIERESVGRPGKYQCAS